MEQAISRIISHQIPARPGGSASCGTATPAASPRPADATDPVADVFAAVHATSANDVWAVGHGGTSSASTTLTEHWDGTSWTLVPSLNPGTADSLLSVTATSATDVWAVGETQDSSGFGPLIEH